MRTDRSGMRWKMLASVLVLAGLSVSSVWADGYNYSNDGFQQIYSSQGGATPQYFPRIDPDTRPAQTQQYQQYQYAPLRASTTATNPHKALSTKIGEGFSDLWKSPTVKSGIAGGGIGLGIAALTKHTLLWHGTWVGAAYGAGVGVMDEMAFFKRHPLMRKTAKGAVIGLGAATLTGAAALGPAAAVGAGVGAGVHYLKMR